MKLKILNEEVDINVIYHFIDDFIRKPFMQDKIAHNFEKLVLVIGPNYNTKDKTFPDNVLEITGVIKYPETNYFSRDIFVDEYNADLYNFLGYTSRYITDELGTKMFYFTVDIINNNNQIRYTYDIDMIHNQDMILFTNSINSFYSYWYSKHINLPLVNNTKEDAIDTKIISYYPNEI